MNKVGIVSYNLHYNYSNYGSILQTYALQEAIKTSLNLEPVIIDYCPDLFRNSEPSNPLAIIKDKDSDLYRACEFLAEDIRENERKIRKFIREYYHYTSVTYYGENFNNTLNDENLSGYVCGSDAIWSYEYFKTFDDAFYGNHECMKQTYTVSYAASFGETIFTDDQRMIMLELMKNYKAIGIRESTELLNISNHVNVSVKRVLDPTLLLSVEDYKRIMSVRLIGTPYLLIYSRRYDENLYKMAEIISRERNLQIVEISLDIRHSMKHILMYSAGVEEFLSLIYNADYVITNSLHGTIFSILMNKNFYVFSRIHGDIKIDELLTLLGLSDRKINGCVSEDEITDIDYDIVNKVLIKERTLSRDFLVDSLISLSYNFE